MSSTDFTERAKKKASGAISLNPDGPPIATATLN